MNDTRPQWLSRFVLLYQSAPEARAKVPEYYPAHSAYAREFAQRFPGALLMLGPFAEPEEGQPGSMGVFTSQEAAEEFAAGDPFVVNDVVASWRVRTWLVTPE